MNWLPATAFAILILSTSCGNGQSRIESPTRPGGDGGSAGEVDAAGAGKHGDAIEDNSTADDPWADELERPAGVKPIEPAAFVRFLGFDHGDNMSALEPLLPVKHPKLGKRSEIDMARSVGHKYEGHFGVAWDVDSKRIEFLSIRSEDAQRYLSDNGHADENLRVLFGISPGGAHGVLGKPSQVVNRPHAVTYRYEFQASGARRGTVSLEFSKLVEPVQCSAVSVHWFY